jgi:hypothetical protein
MVFGGINRERLQLNEGTLWAGGPYDPVNPQAREALPEVRRLVFEGKYGEAAKLVSEKVMSKPLGQMQYQTAGDLILTFPESDSVKNYRRDLNLDRAVASVEYTAGGIWYGRQVFASPADQVIVVRLSADKRKAISFTAGLESPQKVTVETESGNTLVMRGENAGSQGIHGALKFQVRVKVLADGGSLNASSNAVAVTNAQSVTIIRTRVVTRKQSPKPKLPLPKRKVSTLCSSPTSGNISGCSAVFRLTWGVATPCNCRPTSASKIFTMARTRSLPRFIFNSDATCFSVVRVPVDRRRPCRACGTTA